MKNINIPGVLIHKVHNKTYRLNGIILNINENADTCTMRFRGNIVEKDIPMSKVMINEGFIDKLKEYGSKVANYIVKKVKGFIAVVDEKTNKIFGWSFYNVANMAITYARNKQPEGFDMAISPELAKFAGIKHPKTFNQVLASADDRERKEATAFWSRIMKRVGTTDEPIQESIKYVYNKYYTESNLFKNAKEFKSLNEDAIYTYKNIKSESYGMVKDAEQLKADLITNFRNQISGSVGNHAKIKPLCIWGAPGIGKTAIVYEAINDLANSPLGSIQLNLQYINLGTSTKESWELPEITSKPIDGQYIPSFANTPPFWLPVYIKSSDPKINEQRDEIFNHCKFLAPEGGEIKDKYGYTIEYQGGIVFLDEFSRIKPDVQTVLMPLLGDQKFGNNYVVASKWGFVCAANRAIDDSVPTATDDEGYFPKAAKNDRVVNVLYVPSKEQWIKWARQVNPDGLAKVPPYIVDFIEAAPEHVWYATIENGGYDDILEKPAVNKLAHEDKDPQSAMQDVLDQMLIKTNRRVITPRRWADDVGTEFNLELIHILDGNKDGIPGKEYFYQLVKDSKVTKEDEDGNTYLDYYGGILPDLLVDALNNVDDEYWDRWIKEKGGEKNLPGYKQQFGIKARYNIFMLWVIYLIAGKMSISDSPDQFNNSKAPLLVFYREYKNFTKNFTPEMYESIWNTGKVLPDFQSEDDYTPVNQEDFSQSDYAKWKPSSILVNEVINNLWNNYPGDLVSELDELTDIKSFPNLTDKQVIAEANKLNKQYSIRLNKEEIPLLFTQSDLQNPEIIKPEVQTLLNVPVIQKLANYALWLSKIAIQVSQSRHIDEAKKKLYYFYMKNTSSQVRELLTNKKELVANKNLKNTKEYLKIQNKGLMAPVLNIFQNAMNYKSKKFNKK